MCVFSEFCKLGSKLTEKYDISTLILTPHASDVTLSWKEAQEEAALRLWHSAVK